MRNRPFITTIILLACCVVLSQAALAGDDDEVRRITKEDARKLIDQGATLIDVRYVKNYEKSELKITGAIREDPNDMDAWVDKYPKDKAIILYCD